MLNTQADSARQDNDKPGGGENNRGVGDQVLLTRFLAQRDESAFTALVSRYGGVVWGVCRRLLSQEQDAEDAFQAVFFILACKAASIRKGEAVGHWLYGVAYRTAMKARQTRARRQQREQQAQLPASEQAPWSETACRELQRLLDEEVQRLPGRYQAPFVLCCLEGMSKPEAARELGWKEGTVSGRLAQARKLLQQRLLRRGVSLSAALTVAALTANTASAAAPAGLLQTTAPAVLSQARSGKAAAGTLSPAVVALANSLMRSLKPGWLAAGLVLLLALPLLGAGALLADRDSGSAPEKEKGPRVETNEVRLAVRPPPQRPGGAAFDRKVVALAFSPDGMRLATVGARAEHPGHLKICDLASARELVLLGGIPGTGAVAFSPDGEVLATGEFGGDIKLRDPGTGQERASWKAHPDGLNCLVFAAAGDALLSTGADGSVTLWDVKERKQRQTFVGHTREVVAAAAFRHEPTFVTGSLDGTAIIWDAGTGQVRFRLASPEDRIEAVTVAPDDRTVATVARDGTIRLWDARTGKETAVLEGRTGSVAAVAFSPDGRLLAGAAGHTIHLWDMKTRQRLTSLDRQAEPISTLAFSPCGKFLASGSALGLVLLALEVTAAGGEKRPSQEYVQSFRGGKDSCLGWELKGPDAESCVRFEPAGLRLTLPAGMPAEAVGAGVVSPLTVHGDFEITFRFEVLREPEAEDAGTQTRLILEVLLDRSNPYRNMAAISRKVSARWGRQFGVWQVVQDEARDFQETMSQDGRTTDAKTGQLRLRRTGAVLSYLVAEGTSEEFVLVKQFAFGTEDLKEVRLVGSTGGPQASFDVRITDFHVRADSLSGLPAAIAPAKEPGKGRLAGTVLLSLAVVLAALVGLFAWQRQRKGTSIVAAALEEEQAEPEAAAPIPPRQADEVVAPPARSRRPGLRLLLFALIPVPGLIALGFLAADENPKPTPEQLAWDFRGKPLPTEFQLFGDVKDSFVHAEPEGLRISLPKDRKKLGPGGLSLSTSIRGDVEITVSFEILQAEVPPSGHGAGVILSVNQIARVGYIIRPTGEQGFRWDRFKVEGKSGMVNQFVPRPTRVGRLRLKRTGTTLAFLCSAAAQGEDFQKINECEFGTQEISLIRLLAETNLQPTALDVRITDLRIKGPDQPARGTEQPARGADFPDQAQDLAATTAQKSRWRTWLAGTILLVVPLLALGGWLLWRRQRAADQPAPAPAEDEPAEEQAAAPVRWSVLCSQCGKTLKVKPELAGKKVKCPQCGEKLLVPAAAASL